MVFDRFGTAILVLSLSTAIPVLANPAPRPDLVRTYDHASEGRPQRTVYLRGIPVVSFRGEQGLARADRFTALLQQAIRENWNGADLQPAWERNQFALKLAGQTVWQFDDSMVFPEPVDDRAQTVLLITNRLRRGLGTDVPVTTIEQFAPAQSLFARVVRVLTGLASWYGPGFHGNPSASGEIFDQNGLTAAHQTLPFGTNVRVTNIATGASVVVRITDRGPFMHNRVIDISRGAAQRIGLIQAGVAPVKLEVLSKP
jgi:rare lipoprotein A